MPLIEKITIPDGTIGLWELSETADDLLKVCQLNPTDTARLAGFTAEKRRKEFMASRLLLQKLLPQYPEIIYDKCNGKPSLKATDLNISITHSDNLVAIILSHKKIGIDIEQQNRNIDRVVPRFANSAEIDFIEKSKNPQLVKILLWSAKEAIYKCCGIQGIQFNEQINIGLFDYQSQHHFSGSLNHNLQIFHYKLFFRLIKNNILVYCVQD
nr:4'-phosphopantetheinyl transferase superfamily protein [uncultured Draconibacterium sp.]